MSGRTRGSSRIWGLTGGIASGKTAVAGFLSELSIPVVDADVFSRRLSAPGGAAHDEILQRFGTSDREKLREIVFRDSAARGDLEKILHPHIARESQLELDRLAQEFLVPVLIYEATLLVETGRYKTLGGLIVVDSPLDLRKARLISRSGFSEEMAERILAAQTARLSDEERRKAATIVIENSGTLEELRGKVRGIARDHGWIS